MQAIFQFFRRTWGGRSLPISLGLVASIALASFELSDQAVISELRNRLNFIVYDLRLKLLPIARPEVGHKIVIVDIDEQSLQEEGRWPWSRARLAKLVERLADAGVAVIGFDVVFSEPERNLALELQKALKTSDDAAPGLAEHLLEVAPEVDFDRQFAAKLTETDVVLAYFLHRHLQLEVGALPVPVATPGSEQHQRLLIPHMSGYTGVLEVLQKGAAETGFVSVDPDSDGVIRRAPLLLRFRGQLYPSFALAVAKAYLLADDVVIQFDPVGEDLAVSSLRLTQELIPTDEQGRVIVPYRGGSGSFPYRSASDVLNGSASLEGLEGAIVLIGTSAIGLADLRTTPLQKNFPGVEIHANVLDALLSRDVPVKPNWERGATLILLVFVGVSLSLLLPHMGPLLLTLTAFLTLVTIIFSNAYLWRAHLLDLPLASHVLLVGLVVGANFIVGFLRENSHRRLLKTMFDQYVPPAHIERVLADSAGGSTLSGENREMSVLFCDIRDFTSISESLSAARVKQLLNLYFDPVTEAIFENQGTVDKYVGDLVMAFWGAPLEDRDHASHAIQTGFVIHEITHALNPTLVARGLPEIHVGVGISSGPMNVGDMGSSFRRAYTVLGDAVNLGARLESLTKYYGVPILVGERAKAAASMFEYRLIDRITVKGKTEPVSVYEPLAKKGQLSRKQTSQLDAYHTAINLYLSREWDSAQRILERLLERDPACKLYQVYLDRLSRLKSVGVPESWDGTFAHSEK